MRLLLAAGAVPDTWAPNGSSALMLAASANGVAALQVRPWHDRFMSALARFCARILQQDGHAHGS